MTDLNSAKDWRALCELTANEKDPTKLVDLAIQLNQALEECYRTPRAGGDVNRRIARASSSAFAAD
jgi:hypothetical protein